MNISTLSIPLTTTPEQVEKLVALQNAFAMVCNALAPVVRDTRCWSRVALHHMMYRSLREQFPQMGSQMVCNAIYSVSRTSRLIFQADLSPFNIERYSDKMLPLLQFLPTAPVYFDRHTLSLKPGSLSMYTLDGRMRFEVNLSTEDLERFKTLKLNEVILNLAGDLFTLNFSFADNLDPLKEAIQVQKDAAESFLPEYVLIEEVAPAASESASLPVAPPTAPALVHVVLNPLNAVLQPFLTQAVPSTQSTTDMKLNTIVMQHVTALSEVHVAVKQEVLMPQVKTHTGASS